MTARAYLPTAPMALLALVTACGGPADADAPPEAYLHTAQGGVNDPVTDSGTGDATRVTPPEGGIAVGHEPDTRWPAFGGVAHFSSPRAPTFAAPSYLSFQVDPRTQLFSDGRILTEVSRVSDGNAFGTTNARQFSHQYAKVSPWNADNSAALLFAFGSSSSAVLVDGKTFAFKRTLPGVATGGRWSTVDPQLYYQIGAGWTPRLDATDTQTLARRIVKNFAPDGYVESARTSMFGGEGNQSTGDRYWALQMRHSTRGWELVTWDRQNDAVLGHVSLPSQAGIGSFVDYWSISPQGHYLITYTSTPWTWNRMTIPRGPNVWSLDGTYLRSLPVRSGTHVDYCLDTEGNEVVAFIGSKYASSDKIGQTWRLDGSSGNGTTDQFDDGLIGWNFHISCASTSRPGYAVISDYPSTTPSVYNSFPLWNHIWAVRLDGSKQVAVIANAHHDATSSDVNVYNRSAFAVANRDLSAVWFTASWDSTTAPIHSFVARPALP